MQPQYIVVAQIAADYIEKILDKVASLFYNVVTQ